MPSKYANPHIGNADVLEIVEEELIEVKCGWTDAKRVILALRKAHPYQEPIIDIIPLIDEDQL